MDIQRIVLIIGLAITSYMLILAWNEDYKISTTSQEQLLTNSAPTEDLIPTQADIVREEVTNDLPSVVPQQNTEEQAEPTDTGKLVKISTDVLNVWISTVGGDITRVDLPKYPQDLDTPDMAFVLVDPRNSFVAQSGLIGADGPDARAGRARYVAGANEYTMSTGEKSLSVDLHHLDANGTKITKRFSFERESYQIKVEFIIENNSPNPWAANLFAQIKRDGQEPAVSATNSMGLKPYVGGATHSLEAPYHKLEFSDLSEEPFKESIEGGYIAMVQHYFVTAWVPATESTSVYQARKVKDKDIYLMGFTGAELQLAPGDSRQIALTFYAGPKKQHKLAALARGLDLTVDYGFLWWIAQPLFSLLEFIHSIVGNWAIAIILLTVIVKLLLYPLSAASFRSMAKMRKLQPEMARLKERYGDDRQKFSQAMMDLYKKEGANPLGGCLPMLLQMPVFLALYWTLMESVELRQAPFIFWIKDLSIMDPYFVLPILMGISMFLTQMMQPEPPDPIQARVMKLMPVMFTFFFLWFPAGLVLYWLVNNIISVLQQWYVTRQIERAGN